MSLPSLRRGGGSSSISLASLVKGSAPGTLQRQSPASPRPSRKSEHLGNAWVRPELILISREGHTLWLMNISVGETFSVNKLMTTF